MCRMEGGERERKSSRDPIAMELEKDNSISLQRRSVNKEKERDHTQHFEKERKRYYSSQESLLDSD